MSALAFHDLDRVADNLQRRWCHMSLEQAGASVLLRPTSEKRNRRTSEKSSSRGTWVNKPVWWIAPVRMVQRNGHLAYPTRIFLPFSRHYLCVVCETSTKRQTRREAGAQSHGPL